MNDDTDGETKPLLTRVWHSLFGSKDQQLCATCKNPLDSNHRNHSHNGSSYINNAYLTAGNGQSSSNGSSSPLTINNLQGSAGAVGSTGFAMGGNGISGDTLVALEKEKSLQAETALKAEQEKQRWFNSLVLYLDERLSQEKKEFFNSMLERAGELMDEHHHVLREIHVETEKMRQESLPKILQHDLEKSRLLHEQALEKLRYIGNGIYTFAGDKERMKTTAITLSGLTLGFFAAKHGTKVAADYISSVLLQPALVKETSRLSLNQLLLHPFATIAQRNKSLPELICNPEFQAQINEYMLSIVEGRKDGIPFRHALFFGEPGTGKTLLAQHIATKLGLHHAVVPAGNLSGTSAHKLTELFSWANRGRGTVLFFDELDALPNRLINKALSEEGQKVLSTFLAETGTENTKTLVLGATNVTKNLDPAVANRLTAQFEFPLPNVETREKLLTFYFEKYVNEKGKIEIKDSIDFYPIAWRIQGFSGRDILNLTLAMRAKAYTNKRALTADSVDSVVNNTIKSRHNIKDFSMKELTSKTNSCP